VAELVVPFMAGAYIVMAVIIIVMNISQVPGVLGLIFRSAFDLEPALGGIFGMTVSWGVKRGIYSNEAGQGTAPHAAAAAEVSHPAKQGLVQAFSVYVDTLFVCTATAFMILFTGQYNVANPAGGFLVENIPDVAAGPQYTQQAISTHLPSMGAPFVAIALFFFAFTTLMAYYYIAETNLSYLNKRGLQVWKLWVLRVLMLLAVFYGSVKTAEAAWVLGDIGVGVMAWLNIVAILLLQKPALKALKDYEKQRKQGLDPRFNAVACGIKDAEEWNVPTDLPIQKDCMEK
jgi:AGCS family alanine or glycine:cation symporter